MKFGLITRWVVMSVFVLICFSSTARSGNVLKLKEIPGTAFTLTSVENGYTYRDGFFMDQKTGWFSARDRIVYTEDGGKTWQRILEADPISFFFVDKQTGWWSTSWAIYRTDDGGKNWDRILDGRRVDEEGDFYIDENMPAIRFLLFFTREKGLGLAQQKGRGGLLRTEDGGKNWNKVYETPSRGQFYSLFFLDPLRGWISGGMHSGPMNFVLSTKDGGKNWEHVDLGAGSVKHLTFLDDKTGWAAGSGKQTGATPFIRQGVIFRTTDGKTWKRGELPPEAKNTGISHIYMKTKKEGWAVGREIILHTVDGGATWRTLLTQPGERFNYITLVEQDGKPALLIASWRALFRIWLR